MKLPLSPGIYSFFPAHLCVTVHIILPPRKTQHQCLDFVLRPYYVGMTDLIIGHMIELSLYPPPLLEDQAYIT